MEVELLLLDFLCQLNAPNRHGRRLESVEPEHRPDPLLYSPVILFDHAVEVFAGWHLYAARQDSKGWRRSKFRQSKANQACLIENQPANAPGYRLSTITASLRETEVSFSSSCLFRHETKTTEIAFSNSDRITA